MQGSYDGKRAGNSWRHRAPVPPDAQGTAPGQDASRVSSMRSQIKDRVGENRIQRPADVPFLQATDESRDASDLKALVPPGSTDRRAGPGGMFIPGKLNPSPYHAQGRSHRRFPNGNVTTSATQTDVIFHKVSMRICIAVYCRRR